METKKKYVWLKFLSISKPVIEIENKPQQVFIRILPYGAEHLTIHKKIGGELIKNYSLPYIAEPNWINAVETIAKEEYRDWKKHLKYAFAEQPLRKLENVEGYHLLGRLIDLENYSPKEKYTRQCDYEFSVKNFKFMINLYLSTVNNPIVEPSAVVKTTLGNICLRFERAK